MSENSVLSLENGLISMSLSATPTGIVVEQLGRAEERYTWWNVVWIELIGNEFRLDVVRPVPKKESGCLHTYRVPCYEKDKEQASLWIQQSLKRAYPDTKHSRRMRVLVNPHGGQGGAEAIFSQIARPILEAGHCKLDVTSTQYSKHAYDLVSGMPLDIDCLVTVSGDGLIHEAINGLADHAKSEEALRIPIAPIPAGSANGLCVNIFGVDAAFDVAEACLNAMKGRPMRVDLCSVNQGGKQSWSFMTQALGLMAELDLGTEHLRWMGEARFMYGFFRGMISLKPCEVRLEFKMPQQDKPKLLSKWNEAQAKCGKGFRASLSGEELRNIDDKPAVEEWVVFDKPWLWAVGGKVPFTARSMNQFPIALTADGYIDVVVQEVTSRRHLLSSIDKGRSGQHFFDSSSHYMKCKGYRITPLVDDGYFSVDGEHFPFAACEVNVHEGVATLMSPTGCFVNDFAGKETHRAELCSCLGKRST